LTIVQTSNTATGRSAHQPIQTRAQTATLSSGKIGIRV